ncbi:hypothetical protein [Brachybacterium phenoliresistens]|nr:hypothetical protein [Brachybacterium phenoliresistens]
MAQNSWDARLPERQPVFGVSLRRTNFRYRDSLAELIREGRLGDLGGLVRNAGFRVLEIYDRGTAGLDGPADLSPVGKGASARFQDLILKFGVPHNNGSTGGTYGFGKTAAFAYSGIGTVVYWTRCRNSEGHLEDRFIVSAFSDSYEDAGVQYTGRHWWGRLTEEGDSILPIVGEEATELGERFFETGFAPGETGTSMLILDPLVTDPDDMEDAEREPLDRHRSDAGEVERDFARRARHVIRANLWPKMIAETPASGVPMEIRLHVNGEPIDLGSPEAAVLAHWGAGLNAIRRFRAGGRNESASPTNVPITVLEIKRYDKVIGHLALVRRIPNLEIIQGHVEDDDLDPSRTDARLQRIALMRGQAELVVTTVDWVGREPFEGMDWLAVYKSADEFDQMYADAEPPAHDSWVTDGSSSEAAKIVRHTRTRVKQLITRELYPETTNEEASAPRIAMATGALSRRLGAILPAAAPTMPAVREGGGAGRRRATTCARWVVEAEPPRLISTDAAGRQRQEVEFQLSGGTEPVGTVRLSVSLLGDEGLHELVPPEELDIEWGEGLAGNGAYAHVPAGSTGVVRFSGAPRRAMRVELTAGGIDGRS